MIWQAPSLSLSPPRGAGYRHVCFRHVITTQRDTGSCRERETETSSQITSYTPCSDLHCLLRYLSCHATSSSALQGGNSMKSDGLVPRTAAVVWPCAGVRLSRLMEDRCWCLRWLCVKDDLRNLSVLYRSAIVVSCCVAEGKAGLCASGRWFVRYLPHPLSPIMRVWTLWDTQGTLTLTDTINLQINIEYYGYPKSYRP